MTMGMGGTQTSRSHSPEQALLQGGELAKYGCYRKSRENQDPGNENFSLAKSDFFIG